jgi:hypothetical protein
MYKKNEDHKQYDIFDTFRGLPLKMRERLEGSWADTFYREVFCRIDEDVFAVLYSEEASRPNVPVNVLVGLEIMKAGFGWSDEEMYDAYCFNMQVRYALGERRIEEGYFELRTVYNFRRRLTEWMEEHGENLLEVAFEQITDEQLEALELKTEKLRMDSTQIASNIREMSRLQLLVEVVKRMGRELTDEDRAQYAELLEPYEKGTSGQYVYQTKPEELDGRLLRVGRVMEELLEALGEEYGENAAYQVMARVFEEHFVVTEEGMRAKEGQELSADSLQSPDDLEATYRRKRNEGYRGYVTNVTETCDPENPLQLIVDVQTAPNVTDDAELMAEALPELEERTEMEVLYTDGGYNGEATDAAIEEHPVEHIQSAIRGGKPDPEKLQLSDFEMEEDDEGEWAEATCPAGKKARVEKTRTAGRYKARFKEGACESCPLIDRCPAQPLRRHRGHVLYFDEKDVKVAQRRQRTAAFRAEKTNPRAAVEATMRSIKHPFGNGKLPVRGLPRMSMMMVASAAMCNARRIWRYEIEKKKEMVADLDEKAAELAQKATELAQKAAQLGDSLSRFAGRVRDFLFGRVQNRALASVQV